MVHGPLVFTIFHAIFFGGDRIGIGTFYDVYMLIIMLGYCAII